MKCYTYAFDLQEYLVLKNTWNNADKNFSGWKLTVLVGPKDKTSLRKKENCLILFLYANERTCNVFFVAAQEEQTQKTISTEFSEDLFPLVGMWESSEEESKYELKLEELKDIGSERSCCNRLSLEIKSKADMEKAKESVCLKDIFLLAELSTLLKACVSTVSYSDDQKREGLVDAG